MSLNAFTLARRHSIRNEHDLVRKLQRDDKCTSSLLQRLLFVRSGHFENLSHTHRIFAGNSCCITEEDMMDPADDASFLTPPSSPLSKKDCLNLLACDSPLQHLQLPSACEQFDEIKVELSRRLSNRSNQAIAFEGLSGAAGEAAAAARNRGQLSHAQIQRRMTNSNKPRLW
jgi:hypothetical protein